MNTPNVKPESALSLFRKTQEITATDKANMKRMMLQHADGLEKIAKAQEKAAAENRSAAASLILCAELADEQVKAFRQQARQSRDAAKEL